MKTQFDIDNTIQFESTKRFKIDFFEFSVLVEACIPPRPIARSVFWDSVINTHYHNLTSDERQKLFEWINHCSEFKSKLLTNEDCQLFNARFDPNNQYLVKMILDNQEQEYEAFLWKDRYHTAKNKFLNTNFILSVSKMN